MIVVSTPTGHIGSQVVRLLLEAGEPVRVIARDPARLAPDIRDRVEVVQGSTDDEDVLTRAFDGAESLFWVVPPSFQAPGAVEHYLNFARPACRAVTRQGVNRVVAVSALGRGTPMEHTAGLATGAFAGDDAFAQTGVHFRALWCPGFMENLLMQVEPLKRQGMFFAPARADLKAPHAATQDIAAVGARLLLDRSWTGQGGQAVLGPEDLSYTDMAAVLTDVLGTPIQFQSVPPEAARAQLLGLGASETFARDYLEMFAAKDAGLDNAAPRTAESTTPTRLRQWAEDVLKPAVQD